MYKLILALLLGITLFTGSAQAQSSKRYGFTQTIRVHNTSKEDLLNAVQEWVKSSMPKTEFMLLETDADDAYITGTGKQITKSGTSTYDLTFYVKRNVVDVVADNVSHNKKGRAPKEERGPGTLRKKTKTYLSGVSHNLRQHLLQAPAGATVSTD
jgi:hypothetical protein